MMLVWIVSWLSGILSYHRLWVVKEYGYFCPFYPCTGVQRCICMHLWWILKNKTRFVHEVQMYLHWVLHWCTHSKNQIYCKYILFCKIWVTPVLQSEFLIYVQLFCYGQNKILQRNNLNSEEKILCVELQRGKIYFTGVRYIIPLYYWNV